jgi:hypothetical protein
VRERPGRSDFDHLDILAASLAQRHLSIVSPA